MAETTWIGRTLLGRYQVTRLLGQGGMAEVYQGYDPNLGRPIAIKMIHPHLASDPGFLGRFEREAQAIARLRHPNIVQVFDFNHEGDTYFMIMEYIDGATLHSRLQALNERNERMPAAEAVGIMIKLADAMHYAHSLGMVHRDLKPSNIMFTSRGEPVITDFGLARIIGGTSFTATGSVMGTPLYMSPEQGKGESGSARSDIYSLGIILYEMVTGKVPYTGDTPVSVMLKHITEPLPTPLAYNPSLSPMLVGVIETALAKDPAHRFPSAEAMSNALSLVRSQLASRPPAQDATAPVSRAAATVFEAPPKPPMPSPETITAEPLPAQSQPIAPAPVTAPAAAAQATGRTPAPSVEAPSLQHTTAEAAPPPPVMAQPSGLVSQARAEEAIRMPPPAPARPAARPNWAIIGGIIGAVACLLLVIVGGVLIAPTLTGGAPATATSAIIAPTQAGATTEATAATAVIQPTQTVDAGAPSLPATTPEATAPEGMILIPAGEFIRGSDSSSADTRPQRSLSLSAFYIDQTEVTNAQFAAFVEQTGYVTYFESLGRTRNIWRAPRTGVSASDRPDYPVVHVVWQDAYEYCRWAGKRLPTEAEWEKAARGTDGRTYPWGNDFDATRSNSALNPNAPGDAMPVGSFPAGASPYGVLDMSGNVWEYVNDTYSATYFATAPDADPPGPPPGSEHVLRGGGWINDRQIHLSAIFRDHGSADFGDEATGFRCAADAAPTPPTAADATATVPPGPYVRINGIAISNGKYIVEYETFEYQETLPGMHVHFFFDTVTPDQAGVPGAGPWVLWGGPRPFDGYSVSERPAAAKQMCALVANADHSVRQGTGNCVALPDAAP